MAHVKTAISIDVGIFKDIERVAHRVHISRSRLFEIAVRDWLKRQKKKLLIEQINSAVEQDAFDEEERRQMEWMREHQKGLVQGEW